MLLGMKLRDLYPTLSADERDALAKRAGTEPGYLWQIATQWRGKRASISMMQKLAAAEPRLHLNDLVAEFTVEANSA